jgi:hypothetical protein
MAQELISIRCDMELTAAASHEQQDGAAPALPRFSIVANSGSPMHVFGFYDPVVVDMEGVTFASDRIPVLAYHDTQLGVGHADDCQVKGGKILVAGVVSRDTETAREVVTSGKNGFPWQASIGATIISSEDVSHGAKVKVNGKTHVGPLVIARKCEVYEVSFVPLGADSKTSAQIAAQKQKEGGAMPQLKERALALTSSLGEAHKPAILASLIDGASDEEIAAQIKAREYETALADKAALAAEVEALKAQLADSKAAAEQAAMALEEIKAAKPATRPLPVQASLDDGKEEIETITRAQARTMTRDQLAKFKAGKLLVE